MMGDKLPSDYNVQALKVVPFIAITALWVASDIGFNADLIKTFALDEMQPVLAE